MNKIKFYLYSGSAIVGVAAMGVLVFWTIFRTLPDAKKTIGVKSLDGYSEETEAAMDIWNSWVGCEFFVAGDDVIVMSDDGDPCGDPWREKDEWNRRATAYTCGSGKWEILISRPGNTNTQACIIAHELGHVIGRDHNTIGVMGLCSSEDQNFLRIRDADAKAIKAAFCR